jgi:hypothetical protein
MNYHRGIDSISSSGVKLIINKTPAHFHQRYAEGAPEPVSRALVFGSAFHALVLEGEAACRQRYGFAPAHPGTAKYSQWLANEEFAGGLKQDDWDEMFRMRDGVYADSDVAAILAEDALVERRIDWVDLATGANCKAKPDWLASDHSVMIDLKTTTDASNYGIHTAIRRYDYDLSAAMYVRAVESVHGVSPKWGWLFVEKESCLPRLVWASDETLEAGNAKLERGLALYADCIESGRWPGYETLNL